MQETALADKKGKEMKKGIIFDVDGTLWDACAVIADSWNDYLKKYVTDMELSVTEEDVRKVMGMTMKDIADTCFPMIEETRREKIANEIFQYEVDYMKEYSGNIYPDTVEIMRELAKEYHIYICSNCQLGYIDDFIKHAGVADIVEDFVCYGDTEKTKDYNIRLVVERNQLDAAVYVGDTQGDYNSTCKAGLPFIFAGYGLGEVNEEVTTISCMKELPAAVKTILG